MPHVNAFVGLLRAVWVDLGSVADVILVVGVWSLRSGGMMVSVDDANLSK